MWYLTPANEKKQTNSREKGFFTSGILDKFLQILYFILLLPGVVLTGVSETYIIFSRFS